MTYPSHSIAVLIPCYNESHTIKDVISSFRQHLPQAKIYVYDNNSTDGTGQIAKDAGAIVGYVSQQGKGHVIRRMFADIESDIYIMIDGDNTYPTNQAPALVNKLITERLDMVTGIRIAQEGAFRNNHSWGNKMFTNIIRKLFGAGMNDIFSGYRVFSRRFVKSFPALSRGFELETELSVHALELQLPYGEVEVPYHPRPEGSHSKLHTYKDGIKILFRILMLYKEAKPLKLFSALAASLLLLDVILAYPIIITWLNTGLVPRFPTAFIIVGIFIFASISLASGIILDGIAQLRRENKRLNYIKFPGLADA